MVSRAGVIIVALALAAVLVSACGGKTVDNQKLESELTNKLGTGGGESVTCPDDEAAEEGRQFSCQLSNGDKTVSDINVTLTDDDGGYKAALDLDSQKLEDELVNELVKGAAQGASATCPDDIVPEKGKQLTCQLTDGGQTYEVDVTLTDDKGSWKATTKRSSS